MGKFFLFVLIMQFMSNPLLAIVLFIIILYVLDRRFLQISPGLVKPLRRIRRISSLKEELKLNPHHTANKLELARLLIEQKRFAEAEPLLREALKVMNDSAEVLAELGYCQLKLTDVAAGKEKVLGALERNPRLKYGEPYLWLSEALAASHPDEAVGYLEQFCTIQSSSCEAYYRMGKLYKQMGRIEEAQRSFRETVELYKTVPRFRRRFERKWAWLARLQR